VDYSRKLRYPEAKQSEHEQQNAAQRAGTLPPRETAGRGILGERGERRVIESERGTGQRRRLRWLGIDLLFAQPTSTVRHCEGLLSHEIWTSSTGLQDQGIPAGVFL